MSEFEDVTRDYSISQYVELLPPRCRECLLARFVLTVASAAVFLEHRPLSRIIDIDLNCPGYQGPDETSDLYSPDPAFDRSGCPYADIIAAREVGKSGY